MSAPTDLGWVQTTSFVATGLISIVGAAGARRWRQGFVRRDGPAGPCPGEGGALTLFLGVAVAWNWIAAAIIVLQDGAGRGVR